MAQHIIIDAGLVFSQARRRRTGTTAIILHHPDADWTVWQTHDYHKHSQGYLGIGYNIYIHKDGSIYWGRGLEYEGAHAAGYNSTTIGVSCQGQYHSKDRSMPDPQYNALVWVLHYLRGIYGGIPVRGHRDIAATACPGQYFPLAEAQSLTYRGDSHIEEDLPMDKYNELKTENGALKKQITALEERLNPVYNTLADVPNWGQAAVQDAISRGILQGVSKTDLGLSWMELRLLVLDYRREQGA